MIIRPLPQGLPVVTASVINHEASSGLDIHRHITEAVHLGTSIYQLKTDLLAELAPDLLLTQELCDVCAVAYRLVSDAVKVMEGEQTIVSLEPTSISGILDTIDEVGRVTGRSKRAAELRISLEARVEQVTTMAARLASESCLCAGVDRSSFRGWALGPRDDSQGRRRRWPGDRWQAFL